MIWPILDAWAKYRNTLVQMKTSKSAYEINWPLGGAPSVLSRFDWNNICQEKFRSQSIIFAKTQEITEKQF